MAVCAVAAVVSAVPSVASGAAIASAAPDTSMLPPPELPEDARRDFAAKASSEDSSRASFFAFLLMTSCSNEKELFSYVNTFIGTGGHGHTFPGATVPFGMVQLSPDTRLDGWDGCGGYHYSDSIIYGFSHTHLSGTGVSDYGDVLIAPTVGQVNFNNGSD